INPAGTHERLDERAAPLLMASTAVQRLAQLREMRLESVALVQQTAIRRAQVMKVQRLLLTAGEFAAGQDGVHRLAQDARLDHRAGVEADDRLRVKQRIVKSLVGVHRLRARPLRDMRESAQFGAAPLCEMRGMRADQD